MSANFSCIGHSLYPHDPHLENLSRWRRHFAALKRGGEPAKFSLLFARAARSLDSPYRKIGRRSDAKRQRLRRVAGDLDVGERRGGRLAESIERPMDATVGAGRLVVAIEVFELDAQKIKRGVSQLGNLNLFVFDLKR